MKASVGDKIVRRLTEFTEALENKETISQLFNCRQVMLNLKPVSYSPQLVRKTRELLGVSQALFAQFLGVSPRTVRAWEQGINTPKDMACRFMDEIRRDPPYWQHRLHDAIVSR